MVSMMAKIEMTEEEYDADSKRWHKLGESSGLKEAAGILKLGAEAAESKDALEEVLEVMQKMRSREFPVTRAMVKRICQQFRDAIPKTHSHLRDAMEETLKDLETLADPKPEKK